MNICILIPSYKRIDLLQELMTMYNDYDVDIVVIGQCYTQEQVDSLKLTPKTRFINFSKPLGAGGARKEGFNFIFSSLLDKKYDYILMHDDDFKVYPKDIETLSKYAEDPEYKKYNIFCPGYSGLIGRKKDREVRISKACFWVWLLRTSELKKVYDKLTDNLRYYEDKELTYLLGNKGVIINERYFEEKQEFTIMQSVIGRTSERDAIKSEAIAILKEKYGDVIQDRKSKQYFDITFK